MQEIKEKYAVLEGHIIDINFEFIEYEDLKDYKKY